MNWHEWYWWTWPAGIVLGLGVTCVIWFVIPPRCPPTWRCILAGLLLSAVNCESCSHQLHGPDGCTAKVCPSHSLSGEPCPCEHTAPPQNRSDR